MNGTTLTLLIVGGTLVLVAAVLVLTFVLVRRGSRRWFDELSTEMVLTGERIVRGPDNGNYLGGSGGYSKVKGNAALLLTDRRLVIRRVSGGVIEVPRARIASCVEAKSFQGTFVVGRSVLVIATDEGAALGILVPDLEAWRMALAPHA